MSAASPLWTGEETLVPSALRGYRSWSVRDQQLTSTGVKHVWEAPEVAARCISDGAAGSDPDCPCDLCVRQLHQSPVRDCSCGIYGWYRPEDSRLVESDVFGVVEATGRVVLASHGFRAEKARIVALAIEPSRNRRSSLRFYEPPTPTDLHEIAKWAKTQGIPVFPTRAELLDAYPPQNVTELVAHECDETCQAHPQHSSDDFSAAIARQIMSLSFPSSTYTYSTNANPFLTRSADYASSWSEATPEAPASRPRRFVVADLICTAAALVGAAFGVVAAISGAVLVGSVGVVVNGGCFVLVGRRVWRDRAILRRKAVQS